jgi:hypothetical protein
MNRSPTPLSRTPPNNPSRDFNQRHAPLEEPSALFRFCTLLRATPRTSLFELELKTAFAPCRRVFRAAFTSAKNVSLWLTFEGEVNLHCGGHCADANAPRGVRAANAGVGIEPERVKGRAV